MSRARHRDRASHTLLFGGSPNRTRRSAVERQPGLEGFREADRRVLEHARRLAHAVPENDAALADNAGSFLAFWQADASILFRKEEEVLLPVLARHKEVLGEPVIRMLAQHASIRGLVMELGDEVFRAETRPETLRSLGEQLEAHVRLEEREVLPLIEETLPAHALEEVGARLAVFEAGLRAEPWVPSEGLSFDPWPGPGDSEGGGFD
jgi:iron-sulfur cluster repair protein YtfE (RIC family)